MYSSSAGRQSGVAGQAATSSDEPAEGCLIEFQKDTKTGLALLLKKDGKRNWTAVDTRCARLAEFSGAMQTCW
jgi:hypothetical protein